MTSYGIFIKPTGLNLSVISSQLYWFSQRAAYKNSIEQLFSASCTQYTYWCLRCTPTSVMKCNVVECIYKVNMRLDLDTYIVFIFWQFDFKWLKH